MPDEINRGDEQNAGNDTAPPASQITVEPSGAGAEKSECGEKADDTAPGEPPPRTPWRLTLSGSTFLATVIIALATAFTAVSSYLQWHTTVITDRPWVVGLKPMMVDYLQEDKELDAFGQNSGGTYAVVEMLVENSGKSPAVNVSVLAELFFPRYPTNDTPGSGLAEEQKRFCNQTVSTASQTALSAGSQNKHTAQWSLSADNSVVLRSNKKVSSTGGKEGFLVPAVVVCVAYSPAYDLAIGYRTGISYIMRKKDGSALKFGERVRAQDLLLEPARVGPFIQ